MTVKCIVIDNACINDEEVELDNFTMKEGYELVQEYGLDCACIEIRENVMVIAHDDGQLILVLQGAFA